MELRPGSALFFYLHHFQILGTLMQDFSMFYQFFLLENTRVSSNLNNHLAEFDKSEIHGVGLILLQ